MDDRELSTGRLRGRGQYARGMLLLGWNPSGRMYAPEGVSELVSTVEVGIWARALEIVEGAAPVPEGLRGAAALGWRAGTEATSGALRRALEHQAGLLPPPPRRRTAPPPPSTPPAPEQVVGLYRPPGGINWSEN